MIDKLTWFFIGRANAAPNWFDVFKPFVGTNTGGLDAQPTATKLINLITTWVLAFAAVVAFIYLIISGINYITAGGDAEKATKARTGILNAIIGIIVIVLAFIIIRFAIGVGGTIKTGVGA